MNITKQASNISAVPRNNYLVLCYCVYCEGTFVFLDIRTNCHQILMKLQLCHKPVMMS